MLRKILSQKDAVILCLVDDNIWSALDDMTLPDNYRGKFADLSSGIMAEFIAKARCYIVSSNALQDNVPKGVPVEPLHPCWHAEPSDELHFEQKEIKLVHLGTNSHLAGFQFLQPVLEQVIESTPSVTFTYYSNISLLGNLDKHERVIRRRLMRWSKYKKHIGNERFHLGLYPILDTPFNQGRSHNKILEYCLAGCAGLYSSNWDHAKLIDSGENGWLCENNQQDWLKMILHLMNNPGKLRNGFNSATRLFYKLNNLQQQRAFWQRVFIKE